MIRSEMVQLLARIQVQDNRQVDALIVDDWLDTIGDLELDAALAALRRFRRERPDDYLRAGHLLELAGVVDEQPGERDITKELEAEWASAPEQFRDPVEADSSPWAKPYVEGDL